MLLSRGSQFVLVLVALCASGSLAAWSQVPGQDIPQKGAKLLSTRGKQTFASTCANCHGLDGRGGERAPSIADSAKVQKLSDSQIVRIVENGIPGTAMPAFRSLSNADVKNLVTYLRTLQGAKQTVKLPGDANRG